MELFFAFSLSLILTSLIQIQQVYAQGCNITSITSPSASTLDVKWKRYVGATNYFLDLRIVNASNVAPVVVTLSASTSERLVQGLRPGTLYNVTIKVFQFYYVTCLDSQTSLTVPATSQISFSKAISSSAIRFEWSSVASAERYFLIVESPATTVKLNYSFTSPSGVVDRLQPSTSYNCYVFPWNEAGFGASSRVRTVTTLIQPPAGITVEGTGKTTARVNWQKVDKVLLYEITVTLSDSPSRAPLVTNTTALYLNIINLTPCSTYKIGVASVNYFLEPGESSYVTYKTTVMNPVTSIWVVYSCSDATATVNWESVLGATSYQALGRDSSGASMNCSSQSVSCQLTGLRCGQRYQVQVISMSAGCEAAASTPTHFETVPCPPTNLNTFRECSSNVIIFSWAPANNTEYYVATSLASDGQVTECRTAETACFFDNTVCGQVYQHTVYAVGGDSTCNSGFSSPSHIRTAPCEPRQVLTVAEHCQVGALTTSWEKAAGALSYTVEAMSTSGNWFNCSSPGNSCVLSGMFCGDSISVWITASDLECSSERVLVESAQTVPCTPQNVSATSDCSPDSVTVKWGFSPGSLSCIASVMHGNRTAGSCTSSDTSCQVQGLHCGQTYTVLVVASNPWCNSSASMQVEVQTAPCPPDLVKAFLDCSANKALIVWQGRESAGWFYKVVLRDQAGAQLQCSSTNSSCSVPNLTCSQEYSVSVTTNDGHCSSRPSSPIQMNSVACGPQNVWTEVNCGTGLLTVGWDAVAPGLSYYTTAVPSVGGEARYCNSSDSPCRVSGLECGMSYFVQVQSVNGTCLGLSSNRVAIQETPCMPTNVTLQQNCVKGSFNVSWLASRGAKSYTATAVSSSGHRSECSSHDTACLLMDLRCDQVYTVGVAAVDHVCTSPQSQTISLHTVPCPPSNVTGWIDCSSNTASVFWVPSANSVWYTAEAVGQDGHTQSCNSSALSCQIRELRCSQEYSFTVTASDGHCQSLASAPYRQETAPCSPDNIETLVDCDTNILMVSWDSDVMALNYSATARVGDGSKHSCHTQDTGCGIFDLRCGQLYSVSVTASNKNCTSRASAAQTVWTAPCIPQNVQGKLECGSKTLVASWDSVAGAKNYTATVSGPDGHPSSFESTANLSRSVDHLQCAQRYSVSVVAQGDHCISKASPAYSFLTGPCDPENVEARLDCVTNTVMVFWDASSGAESYTLLAQGDAGQLSSCRTTDTSCHLTQLECGATYSLSVLAGDSNCNSTMKTNAIVETAPCPPAIVDSTLLCETNMASVSWVMDSRHKADVLVSATSNEGHRVECSSDNDTCHLIGLMCGQTYKGHAVARKSHCYSDPSSEYSIVTALCPPSMVTSDYDCASNIAIIGWDSQGADPVLAQMEGDGLANWCNTTDSTCAISTLLCSHTYNVSVTALAVNCNSSQSWGPAVHTAPCAPQNVRVSLMCDNNTAHVTWEASPSAVAYNVTAVGWAGDTRNCHTWDITCTLPDLSCGETYDITVTPYSETCPGFPSSVLTFSAASCAPTDVEATLKCEGNIGSVTWTPSLGENTYLATAVDHDGDTHTCSSNDTSCSFTDLQCGEVYSVTVISVDRGCHSPPSLPSALVTAICPPQNLNGKTACETNIMVLSWDASPGLEVTYFLFSSEWEDGTLEQEDIYSTMDTTFFVMDKECGERYSFRLLAQEAACNSSLSPPLEVDTAPCPPTNLSARADCGSNQATVSWSAGGLTCLVEVVGEHGHQTSCSSNGTSCSVELDCGRRYSATVLATTGTCNSSGGAIVDFDSAPCLPDGVGAKLECNTHKVAVQWIESPGSGLYTALAMADDGHQVTCNTSSTACTIQGLRCGRTYRIAVTTAAVHCDVIVPDTTHQVQSAPCEAQNLTVALNCSTNVVTVSWDQCGGSAQSFNVTALGQYGDSTTCSSNGTSCTFTQLRCGEGYTFTVVGVTDHCSSAVNSITDFVTAPCAPTHVLAIQHCLTDITAVSWDSAKGASSYLSQAYSSRGHNLSCVTTDTYCAILDMECGEIYTVYVVAQHNGCVGPASEPAAVTTGPCSLTNLQAFLDCGANAALVSWTPGKGALSYTAATFNKMDHLSCTTNGTACNITGLHCGLEYTISVEEEGLTCTVMAGSLTTLLAAPCRPTQLMVQSFCDSDTVSVSWAVAEGAVEYQAVAESSHGHRAACNSSVPTCDISGLHCGQTYRVSVTATNQGCTGHKSEIYTLRTAPCTPQAVQTSLDCPSGVLMVAWQLSGGALRYHAAAEGDDGEILGCDTDSGACTIPHLLCSHAYNVTVTASDDTCNSSSSPATWITTAPCPPESVRAEVDCRSGIVYVSWESDEPSIQYLAEARAADGHSSVCNTSDSSCALTGLLCGTEYNISLAASSDDCLGADSPGYTIRTGPCVPQLSAVDMSCDLDVALVTWLPAKGAEIYNVTAEDGVGGFFLCTSSQDSCMVAGLQCGHLYLFSLTAYDMQCSTPANESLTTLTAPCPPQDVRTRIDCDVEAVSVSWAPSSSALSYTAMLEPTDGKVLSCTDEDTSCVVTNLPCGEAYAVTVVAEGSTCNSSRSTISIITTAPCEPQQLAASVSCGSDLATVTWSHSQGALLYSVEAVGQDGHSLSCTSSGLSCNLLALHCGQDYAVTILAQGSNCTSAKSQAVYTKTAACRPENVATEVDCESNSITVSWEESRGAEFYTATLEDGQGGDWFCRTVGSQCSVSSLQCGKSLWVTVTASDNQCTGPPSAGSDVHTVPCLPTDIEAHMDCQSEEAYVSWFYSIGALSYNVTATNALGPTVVCHTDQTNCLMAGLACGEEYSLAVLALGMTCNSIAQATAPFNTQPCVPLHLTVRYSDSIVQLFWDFSKGATSYTAVATTEQGLQVSCNSSDTNCALSDLLCDQVYNISVTAHNQACSNTVTSEIVVLVTEPCSPRSVSASVDCDSGLGSVSWEKSRTAVGYVAYLEARTGDSASCHTTDSHCQVGRLRCGTVYYISVIALGGVVNSSETSSINLTTAPCVPESLGVVVDCQEDTALVQWSWSEGADSYELKAEGAIACTSQQNGCNVSSLACGQNYNLSLAAVNTQCSVLLESGVTLQTRPCAPQRVEVDLPCGSSTALLSWAPSDGATEYTANAVRSSDGRVSTCSSLEPVCRFPQLDCGETYSFTVTAHGPQCQSEPSSAMAINTGPCQPTHVTVNGSCDSETVVLSWKEAMGASTYLVTVSGDLGYVNSLNTSSLTLEIYLLCGQAYSLVVTGWDQHCGSLQGDSVQFRTAPCVPELLTSDIVCEASLGRASWAPADGALSYTATALRDRAHSHSCTTTNTSCSWDDLLCGGVYTVRVVSKGNDACVSRPSDTTVIGTAPCVPQNLVASLNCSTKEVHLTWDPSEGAIFYKAKAKDISDRLQLELITNKTSVFFSELTCSHVYSLTVTAYSHECQSAPSEPTLVQMEPCSPTRIIAELDCLSDIVSVSWAASNGAVVYTATVSSSEGQTQTCASPGTRCGITGLRCGQLYSVSVIASGEQCESAPSAITTLRSVPCAPLDLFVTVDCTDNMALVSWNRSEGALFYTANAHDIQMQNLSSCKSTDPRCTLTDLTCGTTYTVQVVASSNSCSAAPSRPTEFQTGPCPPQITDIYLDCFTDSALIEWNYAEGASTYTVLAKSEGGDIHVCRTSYTNCEMADLQCGQVYTVSMVASDGRCNSSQSLRQSFTSVPCAPQNVTWQLDCSTGSALVAWDGGLGAESYMVNAVSMELHIIDCNTTDHACEVLGLLCGSTYNVSVVAVDQRCNVSESAVTEMETAPCIPQLVDAAVDCDTGVVSVSWEHSDGATFYNAVARGSAGYAVTCNASDSFCQFTDLLCGLTYNVTVSGSNGVCFSGESSPAYLNSVPCEAQNVSAQMFCSSNTALVTWEQGDGGAPYLVQAMDQEGDQVECSSFSSSCELPVLHCSQRYNLTVAASDGTCSSSVYLSLQSVPCEPQNVRVALHCSSNSAAVTWEQSSGALSYRAVGETRDGHVASCETSDTYCDLEGLQCGRTYNVSVFSQDDACSSNSSASSDVHSAPCPPQKVETELNCELGILLVRWDPDSSADMDADSFLVEARNAGGEVLSCSSTDTQCFITELPCGHDYAVHVIAIRAGCRSTPSSTVQVSSVPCVPQDAKINLDCVTNSAWVSWKPSQGALMYTVWAKSANSALSCATSEPSCNVPDLSCGTNYVFNVTASNSFCQSPPSEDLEMESAPCSLTNITAVAPCLGGTIQVLWKTMNRSSLYIATAEGQDRSILSCNSTTSSCQMSGAKCGTHYTVIVAASSDKCSSLRSHPYKLDTAPCVPQDVATYAVCKPPGVMVSWSPSVVARSYLVTVAGGSDDVRTCDTTANNCTLLDLRCGQPYSVSVTSSSDTCASPPSPEVTFNTVPCEPDNVMAEVRCRNSSALLTWAPMNGAVEYFAWMQALNEDALHCSSTEPGCTMEGLRCGATYQVSVQASDGVCNSSSSLAPRVGAAPCPPRMVQTRLRPMQDSVQLMQVSWDEADCQQVEYLVEATGSIQGDAQMLFQVSSYWTPHSFFEIPLPCSSTYNVTVKTGNLAGTSKPSRALTGITAPCPPLAVTFSGNFTSAILSWNASVLASSYGVYAVSAAGRVAVCRTMELHCALFGVERSDIEVTAFNAVGESNPTRNIYDPPSSRVRRDLLRSDGSSEEHETANLSIPEVQIGEVTEDTLRVEWMPVEGATYYMLIVREQASAWPHRPLVLSVYSETATVTTLRPATRYCITVSAKNPAESSPYSPPVCVNTGALI